MQEQHTLKLFNDSTPLSNNTNTNANQATYHSHISQFDSGLKQNLR